MNTTLKTLLLSFMFIAVALPVYSKNQPGQLSSRDLKDTNDRTAKATEDMVQADYEGGVAPRQVVRGRDIAQ